MRLNRLFVTLILFGELLFNQGCRYGTLQIQYIFPDGFKGPAVIRVNQNGGIPACDVPWLPRTQLCVLQFPSSGVLNIQDGSPGEQWHRASARYTNGSVIPVPDAASGVTVSKNEIALWAIGSVQNGEDWLFVGTEDEFRKFRDEKHK